MMRPSKRTGTWGAVAGALVVAVALAGGGRRCAQGGKPIKIGFGIALTSGLAGDGKAPCSRSNLEGRRQREGRPPRPARRADLLRQPDQPRHRTSIYTKLLDVDKVDLVVSGYGSNLIAPAIPIVIERRLPPHGAVRPRQQREAQVPALLPDRRRGPDPGGRLLRGLLRARGQAEPPAQTAAASGADAEFPRNALVGAATTPSGSASRPSTTDLPAEHRRLHADRPRHQVDQSGRRLRRVLPARLDGDGPGGGGDRPRAQMFGGGMVGLHFASLLGRLGPKLNGIVDYGFWVPRPTMEGPGMNNFLEECRSSDQGRWTPSASTCRMGLRDDPGAGQRGRGHQGPR